MISIEAQKRALYNEDSLLKLNYCTSLEAFRLSQPCLTVPKPGDCARRRALGLHYVHLI